MVKIIKIHNCYECENMEYVNDKWMCDLTDNEIITPELINEDCPLEDIEEG